MEEKKVLAGEEAVRDEAAIQKRAIRKLDLFVPWDILLRCLMLIKAV
jgi:hypothetical protein